MTSIMFNFTEYLDTAAEKYDKVVFKTDSLFNAPAPEPQFTFMIAGVLSIMGFFLWIRRVQISKRKMVEKGIPLDTSILLRVCIACAIDTDDALYTIVSFGASSFLFLGGIQLNFKWTLLAMILTYMVSSVGETVGILIAYHNTPSVAALVPTSDIMASRLRHAKPELNPSSVYEDLGRGTAIVVMVFVTQVILISFVCIDIYHSDTNNCLDGSKDCPVGGTLGSWSLYVLGVFMACVFQLGPKTKFGESEQNPAYWLRLLLTAKEPGTKVSWYDPVFDRTSERELNGDIRIWFRFLLSFLINGVGYHILVHALPIQIAQQGTLTGIVQRAAGMIVLVDMDDTPGYKLTVVRKTGDMLARKNE